MDTSTSVDTGFADLGLRPEILKALAGLGYEEPTPIQREAIPHMISGKDLLGQAATGTGKTAAFALPILQLLDMNNDRPSPVALVLVPTRELAMQVSEAIYKYGHDLRARCVPIYGGQPIGRQIDALSRGTHVVVATPGRALDHIRKKTLKLEHIQMVVLDEADEMLDMGFREELEEILNATPEGRRTLLFSATMPKPIVSLAKRYQQDALRISTVGEDRGHGDISYQVVTVAPPDIEIAVVNLLRLHEAETAILFCATRENVRRLHASLTERGFNVVALSGEHSQSERNHALQALRDRRARVCVATDVAARGIDLPNLSLVVHVELPRDAEGLQHRSGRTGRAGRKGTAVLIVPYQRRKRVESMLRGAKIEADWI